MDIHSWMYIYIYGCLYEYLWMYLCMTRVTDERKDVEVIFYWIFYNLLLYIARGLIFMILVFFSLFLYFIIIRLFYILQNSILFKLFFSSLIFFFFIR